MSQQPGQDPLTPILMPECTCGDASCPINFLNNFQMRAITDEEGEVYLNFEDFDSLMANIAAVTLSLYSKQGLPHHVLQLCRNTLEGVSVTMRSYVENKRFRPPVTIDDVPDQLPDDWT